MLAKLDTSIIVTEESLLKSEKYKVLKVKIAKLEDKIIGLPTNSLLDRRLFILGLSNYNKETKINNIFIFILSSHTIKPL